MSTPAEDRIAVALDVLGQGAAQPERTVEQRIALARDILGSPTAVACVGHEAGCLLVLNRRGVGHAVPELPDEGDIEVRASRYSAYGALGTPPFNLAVCRHCACVFAVRYGVPFKP